MRTILSALFLVSLIGCKQEARVVLLSGDSWSFFVCIHGSMNKALKNAGVKEASDNATCEVTTRVGIRAENWLGSTAHKATLTVLDEESTRVLYLSLGGNDVLNHWRKSMSPEEAQAVFERVSNQVFEIATLYKKRRPDIKILVSGYDYPRFTENHPVEEYRKAYLQMESPSPFEANTAIVRFSEVMAAKAAAAGVSYIQHYGLTHYYFGNSEQGLEPYLTLNPDQISTPDAPNRAGGDPRFHSDAKAMLQIANVVDAFHLSGFGYDRISEHAVNLYIKNWF